MSPWAWNPCAPCCDECGSCDDVTCVVVTTSGYTCFVSGFTSYNVPAGSYTLRRYEGGAPGSCIFIGEFDGILMQYEGGNTYLGSDYPGHWLSITKVGGSFAVFFEEDDPLTFEGVKNLAFQSGCPGAPSGMQITLYNGRCGDDATCFSCEDECPNLSRESSWSVTLATSLLFDGVSTGCIPCEGTGTFIMDWLSPTPCVWRATIECPNGSNLFAVTFSLATGLPVLGLYWGSSSELIASYAGDTLDCEGPMTLSKVTEDCPGVTLPTTLVVTLVTP